MRRKSSERIERDTRASVRRAEAVLVDAGLSPIRVGRCPEDGCPVCDRLRRAAA